MVKDDHILTDELHKKVGIALFNETWDLMEKENRSAQDDEQLLNIAYSSTYHWSKVGNPINLQRSQWQLSRVYCELDRAEPAMYHARRCLYYTEQMQDSNLSNKGFADFDLAFAYEAVARAATLLKDRQTYENYYTYAKAAGSKIKEKDDREWFDKQLSTINY